MEKKLSRGIDPGEKQKERYLMLFAVAFVGMLICFIPAMIKNDGIFMYYGDFNSQQLMFYKHAQEMVKNGNFGWDWGTDLGTGFVSTYSFYLLGSPFFWLTTLFPVGSTVYLMPWLLSLKAGVAAVCAYAYLRHFISNQNAARIGALMYAFSGFQTYNVFFNHFHDATAFFPLLLLGFELLVQENKKGPFAIAVAISAFISYFFFVCEVVFVVIYFFLRCYDKEFKITLEKFIRLAVESVIGFMMSLIVILPSVIQVMLNFRTKEKFIGLDYILYTDKARIPRIFQAFFTLSDMPARVNIFDVDSARWASIAGYLPLFSMVGVIAYIRIKGKKDWLSRSVYVFILMACVPVLNSAFTLFNASYYARWFYMPILLFCLMTAKILEEDKNELKKGFIPASITSVAFLAVGLLPKYIDGVRTWGHLAQYPELYYIQVGVTLLMIIALGILLYVIADKKVDFHKIAVVMTACACVICNSSEVYYGVTQGSENYDYMDRAIFGSKNINMEKLDNSAAYQNRNNFFYRIDTSENVDNWCMFWNLSSMRCFHSTVTPAILDFYSEIGQTRDVASRMEKKLYPLRGLLSVKYYFDELSDSQIKGESENPKSETISDLQGFHYVDTQNGFNIYENENYIPMGYAFDYYTSDSVLKDAAEVEKTTILTKALVIDDNQAAQYSDILDLYGFSDDDYTYDAYVQNCNDRKNESCYSFEYDTHGFTGRINLSSEKMVFFSVPYEKGWSAVINGREVKVEKVDYGFMAVRCPAGDNEIKFTYSAQGQKAGIVLTCIGFVSLFAYIGYNWYIDNNEDAKKKVSKKKSGKKPANKTEKPDNGAVI